MATSYPNAVYWCLTNKQAANNKINPDLIPGNVSVDIPVITIESSQISSGAITFTNYQKGIIEDDHTSIIQVSASSMLGSDIIYMHRMLENGSSHNIRYIGTNVNSNNSGQFGIGVLTYDTTAGTGTYSYGNYVPDYGSAHYGKFLSPSSTGLTWSDVPVSVSATGTATDTVKYITVNGTEKKIGGTEVSVSATGTSTDEVKYITIDGDEYKIADTTYSAGTGISITSNAIANLDTYQTTAPTAAATDGRIHIVYLTSEPATKYDGYIYLINEA